VRRERTINPIKWLHKKAAENKNNQNSIYASGRKKNNQLVAQSAEGK